MDKEKKAPALPKRRGRASVTVSSSTWNNGKNEAGPAAKYARSAILNIARCTDMANVGAIHTSHEYLERSLLDLTKLAALLLGADPEEWGIDDAWDISYGKRGGGALASARSVLERYDRSARRG